MASISAGDGKALSLAALDDAAGGGVRATSASAVMFAAAAACPASSSISSSRTTALSRLGIGPRYGRRHHIRTFEAWDWPTLRSTTPHPHPNLHRKL